MSEIGMKDQCFGVEVEMTGITREQAAQALAEYFGTTPHHYGGSYDGWSVRDPEGKKWKLVSDASIDGEYWTGTGYVADDIREYRVEMVTPKLTYSELPKLQECVRRVQKAHAKVNNSCGIREKDAYVLTAGVDAWSRSWQEEDYEGNPFPEEVDKDGDGLVYYTIAGESNERSGFMDQETYDQWLDSVLEGAGEVKVPYVKLTTDNIYAIE